MIKVELATNNPLPILSRMPTNEMHEGAPRKLFQFARALRADQTSAEKLLWINLRNRKLHGFKFRRQHPIKNYIADFYCHECKLVIELDGNWHNSEQQAAYDKQRTDELALYGIQVIRFSNNRVLTNMSAALREIAQHLHHSKPPDPTPAHR
jgi:very-short-patch-repair endonuclease